MDTNNHQEKLDFLSNSWCNFAIQSLKPELHEPSSVIVRDNTIKALDANVWPWVWTQPESNYGIGYQKKKVNWITKSIGEGSIKKWVKEVKENRKEEKRLQKAQIHAAVSVAGLARALAALAEYKSESGNNNNNNNKIVKIEEKDEEIEARKLAMASATALIASQCEQAAKLMGAKTFQLTTVLSSALKTTTTNDILTLTAAASTSLRGAATLKARRGWKNRALINGTPVLPIEMDNTASLDHVFHFERGTSLLSKGLLLTVNTPKGKSMKRLVSLHMSNESKVILRIMRRVLLNVITSKKDCVVLNMEAKQHKDARRIEYENSYQIVLTTTSGQIKLDMGKDYERYVMWVATIKQMLTMVTKQ